VRGARLALLVVATLGCGRSGFDVPEGQPGGIAQVRVQLAAHPEYTSFKVVWEGSWQELGGGVTTTGATSAAGQETVSRELAELTGYLITLSLSPRLKAGLWQFTIVAVADDTSQLIPYHVCDPPTSPWVLSDALTLVTFFELPGPSCFVEDGGPLPAGA
jgi:hypothetical protein